MKKTLLTLFCAMTALVGMAQSEKTYTESYVVSVNEGEPTEPQSTDILVVDNGDGTINFVLKDFTLMMFNQTIDMGDVSLEGVTVVPEQNGVKTFVQEGTYTISADKLPVTLQPMASYFENIPYTLAGKMNDERLFAVLEIDMSNTMAMTIDVLVGNPELFFEPAGKTYTEPLVVTIDGASTEPQDADVIVYNNGNGTINFELKNFILGGGEDNLAVGNISVENLPVQMGDDGLAYISYQGNITIQEGDLEGVDMWFGPLLGEIPVVLNGKMNDEKLFVTIDITLQLDEDEQVIHVQLGTDDFEPAGKIYTEPLVIIVDGESTEPQDANVSVAENSDGTINFVLKNFIMSMGDSVLPIGNISVENIATTQGEDGLTHFSYQGDIVIQPGDMPGVNMWYGPFICKDEEGNTAGIPIVLNGKMNDEKLFATIDIELAGQVIHVQLGTDDFAIAIKGDFNGDMRVDAADAEYVLTLIAGNEYSEIADFNEDYEVNAADLEFILSIIAGK